MASSPARKEEGAGAEEEAKKRKRQSSPTTAEVGHKRSRHESPTPESPMKAVDTPAVIEAADKKRKREASPEVPSAIKRTRNEPTEKTSEEVVLTTRVFKKSEIKETIPVPAPTEVAAENPEPPSTLDEDEEEDDIQPLVEPKIDQGRVG